MSKVMQCDHCSKTTGEARGWYHVDIRCLLNADELDTRDVLFGDYCSLLCIANAVRIAHETITADVVRVRETGRQ